MGERRFDLVVLGAGPAGGLSALLSARAGAKTLLVDRCAFPRYKVCGCCLAPLGRSVLEEAGVAEMVLGGTRGVERIDLRVGGAGRGAVSSGIAVPRYTTVARSVLDCALVRAAVDAGAVFRNGVSARVDSEAGGVIVGGCVEHARCVIVADGLGSSSLRHDPRFAWRVGRNSMIGVGAMLGGEDSRVLSDVVDASAVSMAVGRGGYVGVARVSGAFAVGAALLPEYVQRSATGPRGVVEGIVRDAGWDASWVGSIDLKGTPTLTRRRLSVESDGRVFLVGDATGYVEPFTGEGMSWALSGARDLHRHVMSSLRGEYEPGSWSRQVVAGFSRERLGCKGVAWLVRRPSLLQTMIRLADVFPRLGEGVCSLVLGRGNTLAGVRGLS